MRAKPLKILATAALTLIALTAIVAFAGLITLSDYKEATGKYVKAWAYVEGKTYLCPDRSGTDGILRDVKGRGRWEIIVSLPPGSSAGGSFYVERVPDPYDGDWAYTLTIARAYNAGTGEYEEVRAQALIWAYKGTCALLSREDT